MSFWQTMTGSDLTREWKAFEARAEALPAGFRTRDGVEPISVQEYQGIGQRWTYTEST